MKYFKQFDETILKPILIYKYTKERKEKQFEFFDMMIKKGANLEQKFTTREPQKNEEKKDIEEKLILE